jgi:polyhydroxybutyrate depolymerase
MTLLLRALVVFVICTLLAIASGALVPLRLNAAPAPNASPRAGTTTFGGIARTYRVYRPAALARTSPVPLVVVLHGGYGSGAGAEAGLHWDQAADAYGFVALYPDGIFRAWNAGTCCGFPMQRQIDDLGFLTALVEQTMRDENVDSKRVYVTGISNGAMMTYRLACESRLTFAAIGPVAGTFSVPCHHPKPTSVLAIHGLTDTRVPFNGGIGTGVDKTPRLSVPDVMARWRSTDTCAPPRVREVPPVRYETSNCAAGRTVELITIAGAGHQWPGSETPPPIAVSLIGLEQPSRALDATAVLWEFFASHHS